MKTAFLVLIFLLHVLAVGAAFLIAFGYLFFLTSQGIVMTLYAGASIAALCYFAFCPRTFLVTRVGWVATVILAVAASLLALAQLYVDLTFFEGSELSAVTFRALNIGMFAIFVLRGALEKEAQCRKPCVLTWCL
ncbi:hypothetical protein IB234_20750 [Pseudomonas sp. PDM16]|uniref:hypothetical protein n=1 Tax=Pseudomonas sp. PDM16 TaxID=2769292 RepID=UPI001781822C|nr:hypothetical protein [Pseudomonas sp. PDM16]MBD9417002.1 hypothetical protein [Pseudomonas sp. PDM16]